MPSRLSPERRRLTNEQYKNIFYDMILPSILTGDRPAQNKTVALVCGQPGSGKSTMVRQLKNRFGGERTVSISVDDFYNSLPGVNEARMSGEHWRDGPAYEEKATSQWYDLAQKYAEKNDCHIILESCLNPIQFAKGFNKTGYACEAHIIATDKSVSLTSIFKRGIDGFKKGSMANCGVLDKKTHDALYAQWPSIAYDIERGEVFSLLTISTRDAGSCYENRLVDRATKRWAKPGRAYEKLIELNNRHFSHAQIDALYDDWGEILHSELATRAEYKSYPLREYRDEVISYAISSGRSFDPRVVLPQDRSKARKSYVSHLHDDLNLISVNSKTADTLTFEDQLLRIYGEVASATRLRVNVELEMLADINALVAQENSRSLPLRALPSQIRSDSEPAHPHAGGVIERGDAGAKAEVTAKQPVARLGTKSPQSASSDHRSPELTGAEAANLQSGARATRSTASSYGSLDLTEAEAAELERNALAASRKRPMSSLENAAPPAKRARYDARPVELGRGG